MRLVQILVLVPLSLLVTAAFACSGEQQVTVVLEKNAPVSRGEKLTEAIGIETLGGVFTRLIEPGQTLPAETEEIFSTAADNQDAIKISIFRGTASMARQNHHVATFEIYGVQPASRGIPQVQVQITVSPAGDITVRAKDLLSGKSQPIRILARTGA